MLAFSALETKQSSVIDAGVSRSRVLSWSKHLQLQATSEAVEKQDQESYTFFYQSAIEHFIQIF